MEQIAILEAEMTEQKKEAVELHFKIKNNGELAAGYLCEFAASLKKMRDKRLYAELGFPTFDEYVEQAVGIRRRQAYNYIQALESLGYKEMQSNAQLGITKLQLLSKLTSVERKELIESGDAERSSVQELKEIIDGLRSENEQLQFEQNREAEGYARQIEQLRDELNAEKTKPVATVTRELTKAELQALTEKAVQKERKEQQALRAEALKSVDEKTMALEGQLAEKEKQLAELRNLKADSAAATARIAELEKRAKLSGDPNVIRFGLYFEAAQKNIAAMQQIIAGADEETGSKLRRALAAVAKALTEVGGND